MDSEPDMGTPTASEVLSAVGGLFVSDAPKSPEEAVAEARDEMIRAISDDMDYWARLSSGLYLDDVPPDAVADVADEFKEYALDWKRRGKGLDVIGDFKAHRQLRQERFERRERKKRAKQARKLFLASNAGRNTGAGYRGAGGGGGSADLYPEIEVPLLDDPEVVVAVLVEVDKSLSKIEGVCNELPSLDEVQRDMVVRAFDHMMLKFLDPRFKRRYNYTKQDHTAAPLKFGNNVPSYFANVKDQTIYRRKVLSMAGLRNLIMYGPVIYQQLRDNKFSGDLESYGGDTGLNMMRRVTGNVVDLDTTVLRCSDRATLNAINMSNQHKKLKTFNSSDEFSKSDQAREIALHCSQPLMEDFAKMLKLSEKQRKERKIHPDQVSNPIPVASNNTDRGKHPIWHYVNAGQDSFHANVPTMEDVNGALLKAPFHCVLHWMRIHTLAKGEDLEARIDDFFENCIVDSCFNMKWKSIEEFGEKMAHEGTVVDVLQRAQAENQAIFTMAFFDADNEARDNETAEMCKLCVGRIGKDKDGKLRPITREDVAAWVEDPSVTL